MPEIVRIGETFADRRIILRLTQQSLADLAGVSRSSVQALERGSGSIKFASVIEIAGILGLHIDISATTEWRIRGRPDLREVDEADVYIGEELAARLMRRSRDDIGFDYVGEALPSTGPERDRSVSWS